MAIELTGAETITLGTVSGAAAPLLAVEPLEPGFQRVQAGEAVAEHRPGPRPNGSPVRPAWASASCAAFNA